MDEVRYIATGTNPADRAVAPASNVTDTIFAAQIMANAERREIHVKTVDENGFRQGTKYIIRPGGC